MELSLGLLLVRLVLGGLLIGHGVQKVSRHLDGDGLDGTAGFLDQLGFPRPRALAALTGLSELVAGGLLVVGLWLPLAAAAVVGLMVNAAVTVHRQGGLWAQKGGWEYPLVLAVAATALAVTGPGRYSLAEVLEAGISGLATGVLAVAVGLSAAAAVLALRQPGAARH